MEHCPIDRALLESRLRADPLLVEIGRTVAAEKCWVVGGWIRDRAVNQVPPDVDLVVQGIDNAQRAAISLGNIWGTTPRLLGKPDKAVWRLSSRQHKVELWPMKNDDLESDARRRDFTCNALYWRLPDGPLVDSVEGLKDIGEHRIRAISKTNLAADPVRLLRAVRLKATLEGFAVDPRTRAWITELAPGLADAPRERVGAELLALAQAPRTVAGFQEGLAMGLLGPVAPRPSGKARQFKASMEALRALAGDRPHPVPAAVVDNRTEAVLAWLAAGWPPGSMKDLATFAWPKRVVQTVQSAADLYHEAQSVVVSDPAARREFIARCGQDFPTVLALAAAVDSTEADRPQSWKRWWRQWVLAGNSILEPARLLDVSAIVTATSIEPGPQLGRILADLNRAIIRREVRTPSGAKRWLKDARLQATESGERSTARKK